jgi:hypothetical protein
MRANRRQGNPETLVMKAILTALRRLGIVAWRQNPIAAPLRRGDQIVYRSNASGATGISDLGGICPGGRFIAIEVKGATGRIRPRQALYLDEVSRMGGIALVARSVDDVLRLLATAGGIIPRQTWYGVPSPFVLTPEERARYEARALHEDHVRAQRRKRA